MRERLSQRPLADRRLAVDQVVVDIIEHAAETPEGDLRELEDPRGFGRGSGRGGRGVLLLLERAVERVARVGARGCEPLPRRIEVGDPRESRERAVEG